MTHKSIDALLASTMFLLFTMVTPHYEDIAKKLVFIDHAFGATYYNAVNTLPSATDSKSVVASPSVITVPVTETDSARASSTSVNFMTTLSATTPVSHPVSSGSKKVELAQFLVINSGPDMKIDSMALKIIGTAGTSSISNVSLYDANDVQIGTTGATVSADGVTFYFTNLSSVAKSSAGFKFKVKADISSKFTSADNGKTIGIAFAKGIATNTSTDVTADMGKPVNANLMTLSTADIKKDGCDSTTAPWIKVLSPNGGESYKAGEQFTVKWDSCNVSPSQKVEVNIYSSNPTVFGFLADGGTVNDGVETFNLDSGLPIGSNYEITVGVPISGDFNNSALSIYDKSDANFSIIDKEPKAQTHTDSNEKLIAGTDNSDQDINFTRRLSIGKKGDDVVLLQEILIDQGFLTTTNPTGFYGQGTYRAVQKLQKANNIAPTGNVGPATRTLLNSIIEKMDVAGND